MIPNALMRLPAVLEATGLSKTQLYAAIQKNLFTPGVYIGSGKRCRAWPVYEVQCLNEATTAGFTETEISKVVDQLLDARLEKGRALARKYLDWPALTVGGETLLEPKNQTPEWIGS